MQNTRSLLVHTLLALPLLGICAAFAIPQDKKKAPGKQASPKAEAKVPTPPKGAAPLAPVTAPALDAIERRDLRQKFRARHPIEGTYELIEMSRSGTEKVNKARGYLVIGNQFLSLHLYAPGEGRRTNIQSAFRKIRISGDKIIGASLVGHRNKPNGDIVLEPLGHRTEVRFRKIGGTLRLERSEYEYLDFRRVE